MKRVFCTAVLVSLFLGATVLTSFAASEHEAHHPAGAQTSATASSEKMMRPQATGMGQMPCMAASASGSMAPMMGMRGGERMGDMMGAGMSGMMHDGQMGMMKQRMGHMFLLDRVEELGLSSEQVSKLKAIHVECRKDNIRNAAETKIARLELSELLSGDTWTLEEAEPLVRMVHKLEGDIRVRHLQAVSDARKVLTAEQLKQAQTDGSVGNLENLFQ